MSLFYACPELLTSLVLRELPKGVHGNLKALKESLSLPCERAEPDWDCRYPSCLPVLQIPPRRKLRADAGPWP